MREIRKSGSMRGEGKRGVAQWAQATAPLLYSTIADLNASIGHDRLYEAVDVKLVLLVSA
jgi:hypothetical protein